MNTSLKALNHDLPPASKCAIAHAPDRNLADLKTQILRHLATFRASCACTRVVALLPDSPATLACMREATGSVQMQSEVTNELGSVSTSGTHACGLVVKQRLGSLGSYLCCTQSVVLLHKRKHSMLLDCSSTEAAS